jgi:hypothetical protein
LLLHDIIISSRKKEKDGGRGEEKRRKGVERGSEYNGIGERGRGKYGGNNFLLINIFYSFPQISKEKYTSLINNSSFM